MRLFDILGPVMVGPSSSHTAGAVRIGLTARKLLGDQPVHLQDVVERDGTSQQFWSRPARGRLGEDVRVVVSSGFPLLDNAAVKGFYAVGRLPGSRPMSGRSSRKPCFARNSSRPSRTVTLSRSGWPTKVAGIPASS